ncbi:MAG: serine/threonine-protein kinase [Methanobacteriota archaeon]
MPDLVTFQVQAAAVSGILLAVLGGLLLFVRPYRSSTVAFATFLLLWGAIVFFGNMARLSAIGAAWDATTRWSLLHVAVTTIVYAPLVYFASLYPARHGLFARNRLGPVLLLLPAGVGATALFVAPELFYRGISFGATGSATDWGPLRVVYLAIFYSAFFYAIRTIFNHRQATDQPLEVRRSTFVLAALAFYVSYWSGETLLSFGIPLARGAYAGQAAAEAAVFAGLGAIGFVLVAHVTRGMMRGPPTLAALEGQWPVAATVAPAAFGLLSGYASTVGSLRFPVETLGVWRTISAAFLAYAILRFQLFDLDAKVKRGAIGTGIFLLLGGATLGVEQLLERAVGSTGVAVAATQVLLLASLVVVLARLPQVAGYFSQRVLPAVDAPQKLDARRLEVYEAALAQAVSEGTVAAQHDFLEDLRGRLGISVSEHALLTRLVEGRGSDRRDDASRIGPGDVVADRYRIDRLLGDGSFGRAFLATDETLGRRVVLKVLHAHRAADREAVRRFLHEARTMAGVDHPNVVRIFDFGDLSGTPFMVMEYVEGGSLAEMLARAGALPPDEAAGILADMLSGLARVHGQGILHRDLKPGNVLLTREGEAKIADFGLALGMDAHATASGLDEPGFPGGTPATMSPEAVRGLPLTPASDLYSAGAILYHMASGETYLPFEARSAFEIRRAILEDPPRAAPAGADPALVGVATRALEKEPVRRYQSAGEMREALVSSLGTRARTARRR